MSNIFQTQCPTCQHTFAITEEQLTIKSGYARCGSCQGIFPANQYIIGTLPATQPVSQAMPTVQSTPAVQQSYSDDGMDFLFDDSAGLDESGQLVKHDMPNSASYQGKKSRQSSGGDASFDILDNFDDLDIPLAQPTKPQHISQDQNYDDDWVKDLLGTEADETPTPPKSSIIKNQPNLSTFNQGFNNAPNDVDNMLENMGVNTLQERMPTTQEYQEKIKARFDNQHSHQHEVEASSGGGLGIVWVLGSLLLGATLLGQYVFFNVDSLVKNPDHASKIGMLCGIIPSCKLPIADTTQLDIQSQSLVGLKGGKSDLIFTIQNKGTEKAIYPNLKVSLRDGNETFAQFVITPQQYLAEANGKYLLSQQVHPVKLRIESASKKSSQANIEAFY